LADPDSRLRVAIVDARGRPARAPGLAAWLAKVALRRARGAVTIALVSDVRIRALNRTYRQRDYATDVLSFPAEKGVGDYFSAQPPLPKDSPRPLFLGDIAIARGVAAKQARAAGHSLGTELRVLALHGLLHLIGYDHEHDRGRMRRLESQLRRKGGLREGLIERAR
jgi:probable rRNA maturation factor